APPWSFLSPAAVARGRAPADRSGLREADGVLVGDPRQAVEPRVRPGDADVDDELRVPLRPGEELRVDARPIEAAHRPGGEAGRADGEDEVRGLEGAVEDGRRGSQVVVRGVVVAQG